MSQECAYEYHPEPDEEEEQEEEEVRQKPPEIPALFHLACGAEFLGHSVRTHDESGAVKCNVCGAERSVEDAELNENCMRIAAQAHHRTTGARTRMEGEGWLRVWFGERDVFWCAHCCQFSGECCAVPLSRASVRRNLYAMDVKAVTCREKWYYGAVVVAADQLAEFYEGVLNGEIILHTRCDCTGTCDTRSRPCCRGAGRLPRPLTSSSSASSAAETVRSLFKVVSRRLSSAGSSSSTAGILALRKE